MNATAPATLGWEENHSRKSRSKQRTASPHLQSRNVAYVFLRAKSGAAREKLAPASFVKVLIMLSKKTDKEIFNYGVADRSLITGWACLSGLPRIFGEVSPTF